MSLTLNFNWQEKAPIYIRPSLRDLRKGVGLDAAQAAQILQENSTLILSQEREGSDADADFVRDATKRYLEFGRGLADEQFPPPMIDPADTVTVFFHLRSGLGLSISSAARILKIEDSEVENLGSRSSRSLCLDGAHELAWSAIVRWAAEEYPRQIAAEIFEQLTR